MQKFRNERRGRKTERYYSTASTVMREMKGVWEYRREVDNPG